MHDMNINIKNSFGSSVSRPGRFTPKKTPSGDVKCEIGRAAERVLKALEANKPGFEVIATKMLRIRVCGM
jgi:hypothetical protein